MSQFGRSPKKITIASMEPGKTDKRVSAQYNPKELQIDRTVPWAPTGETNNANAGEVSANNAGIHLNFTGAQGRTLSVEMLFDGYERSGADGFTVDVAGQISILEELASVMEPSGPEAKRRPHQCMVDWGTTLRGFKCVIESLSTKYTMFDPSGAPLRAICTVKLKEADTVGAKKKDTAATPTSPPSQNPTRNP